MKPRRQCAKCPWKKGTDPNAIPGGYCAIKHRALKATIAKPADTRALYSGELRMMACHESPRGREMPCVGWLAHQLGPGNNLALRLRMIRGDIAPPETVGPQHERFEDTLPGSTTGRAES